MGEREHLRVGVVIDEREVRRWHETAIAEIERLGFCEVIVLTCAPACTSTGGRAALRHLLYKTYVSADRRCFGSDDDPVACLPLERPRRRLGAIRGEDLDVLLWLAPEAPADHLVGCARFGAWSLYAGGLRGGAAKAQLFWQIYDADFVAPVTLRAQTRTDAERTIYRSVVQSDHVSLHRSRCRAAQRAAYLPARRLRDLHHRGWPYVTSAPVDSEEAFTSAPGRSLPTNAMMLGFLWRVARGVLSRRLAGWLGEKQWFIAYRRGSATPTAIMPPPGRFYADPFLFQRDGRRFIFFEDYDSSCERAVICYLEIDQDGRHGRRGSPSGRTTTSRIPSSLRREKTSTCCLRRRPGGQSSFTGRRGSRTSGRSSASC